MTIESEHELYDVIQDYMLMLQTDLVFGDKSTKARTRALIEEFQDIYDYAMKKLLAEEDTDE